MLKIAVIIACLGLSGCYCNEIDNFFRGDTKPAPATKSLK